MSKLILKIMTLFFFILITSCRSIPEPEGLQPPQTFADKDSKFIKIDGIDIHYKESGTGSPELLLLHGMLGNIDSWSYISPGLSNNHRIIAYDRLAFGLTERPPVTDTRNPYTAEQAEALALRLMVELDIQKPVLVGHSAGGNLAVRLAVSQPEKFSGLILISPGIYTEIPPALIRELMKLSAFKSSGLNAIRSIPEQVDELLEQIFYDPELVTSEMRESYLKPLKAENWDIALWEYVKAQDDSKLRNELTGIKLPVLIIQGREDRVVPVSDNQRIVRMLPDASLLLLDNCGHVAHEEKPEQVIEAIIGFISRL